MPGTLTGQILVFTTLAVFVSTALLGVLHLWKVRTIPAPYDKWVLGTVIAGMPVVGENTWLLSPAGVCMSPITRGGKLQVG